MKKILVSFLASISALMAIALPVTPERALQRAVAGSRAGHLAPSGQRQWSLAMTLGSELYVFGGTDGKGYMILPADDRVTPVLGYSDEGCIDPSNLPDNLAWWLDQYRNEVKYISAHPYLAPRQLSAVDASVEPLVASRWDQKSPYCDQCPTYTDGGYTYQCVPGCVATAMAQVMYYYKWPEKGSGAYSYRATVGNTTKQLTVYFSRSTYQWEQMLDRYDDTATDEARSAVAKLMYDVAVACQMSFGLVSSSYMARPVHALRTYFGYSHALEVRSRDLTPLDQWEQMLRDELLAGRPVLYGGSATGGGHAFVVDGCRTDGYFHINWGWSGMSNGWFLITALSPESQGIGSFAGGYNTSQLAVIGIKPDGGEQEVKNMFAYAQDFSPTDSVTSPGHETELKMQMFVIAANGYGVDPFEIRLGVNVLDSQGQLVQTTLPEAEPTETFNGAPYLARTLSYTPVDLPDGTYQIWPALTNAKGETILFSPTVYGSGYIAMTVSGTKVTLGVPEQAHHLVADNLQVGIEQFYVKRPTPVDFTLHNAGQVEYYDNVYAAFMDHDTIVTASALRVDLMPDAMQSYHTDVTAPAVGGDYVLALVDHLHRPIASVGSVHVDAADDALLGIGAFTPYAPQMPASRVGATATIVNRGGPFMGYLQMFVMPQEANTILKSVSGPFVTIAHGETRQVRFETSFEGVVGETYRLNLRDYAHPEANYLWGNAVSFVLCDEPAAVTGDVTGDGQVDIADANAVINAMLGKGGQAADADVTGDGQVDIADVNAVINVMLGKEP